MYTLFILSLIVICNNAMPNNITDVIMANKEHEVDIWCSNNITTNENVTWWKQNMRSGKIVSTEKVNNSWTVFVSEYNNKHSLVLLAPTTIAVGVYYCKTTANVTGEHVTLFIPYTNKMESPSLCVLTCVNDSDIVTINCTILLGCLIVGFLNTSNIESNEQITDTSYSVDMNGTLLSQYDEMPKFIMYAPDYEEDQYDVLTWTIPKQFKIY